MTRIAFTLAVCLPVAAQVGSLTGQGALLNNAVDLFWDVVECSAKRRVVTLLLLCNGLVYKQTIPERRAPRIYDSHIHRGYTRRRWDLGQVT
jgi:hypothetical protein